MSVNIVVTILKISFAPSSLVRASSLSSILMKNRIWETDKLSKKMLIVLRTAALMILFEVNVLSIVLFIQVNGWKVFSLTNLTLFFSFVMYIFVMLDLLFEHNSTWIWKVANVLYEIFASFILSITIILIVILIFSIFSVADDNIAGLEDGWIEITIKAQMFTAILAIYLLDFYTNRIEFPLRHAVLLGFSILIIFTIYIGVSKLDDTIDDFLDWSRSGSIAYLISTGILIICVFFVGNIISKQKMKRYTMKPIEKKGEKDKGMGAIHISIDNA